MERREVPSARRLIEPPPRDDDGDLVTNDGDRCPDEPEDRDDFRDDDGCPEADNDGDGLLDGNDACPDVAEDRDGFEDSDGCPEPDNDGDHILDVRDRCPNEAEVFNGVSDDDGCPAVRGRGAWPTPLAFDLITHSNGRVVDEGLTRAILDGVAWGLDHEPTAMQLAVEARVAPGGPPRAAERSQRVAAAVIDLLVARGVASERLVPVGLGDRCPLVRGRTRAATERNDSVRFTVVRVDGERNDTVVGCERARDLVPASIGPPAPHDYRPSTADEERAFFATRRDAHPRDVRGPVDVAWAGVIRAFEVVDLGEQIELRLVLEHRYFNWMEDVVAQPTRYFVSPRGEGLFATRWSRPRHAREEVRAHVHVGICCWSTARRLAPTGGSRSTRIAMFGSSGPSSGATT